MRLGNGCDGRTPLDANICKSCYFLVFVQLFEKHGTLIERCTALIEKVSSFRASERLEATLLRKLLLNGAPNKAETVACLTDANPADPLLASFGVADADWRADEERRAASVAAARQEISRLDQVAIDIETANVKAEIVDMRAQLGLPDCDDPGAAPVVPSKEETSSALSENSAAHDRHDADMPGRVQSGVISMTEREVWVAEPRRGVREFVFDRVFDEFSTQKSLHSATTEKAVAEVLNGSNSCVSPLLMPHECFVHTAYFANAHCMNVHVVQMFCYGQTGSGKTHTMFGAGAADGAAAVNPEPSSGLVPRACAQLSRALTHRKSTAGINWTLGISYVQVFGDQVYDLLDGHAATVANHSAEHGDQQSGHQRIGWGGTAAALVLRGHGQIKFEGSQEQTSMQLGSKLEHLLLAADTRKRKAATAMNERSSRAHSLLFFKLKQERSTPSACEGAQGGVNVCVVSEDNVVESTLCMADLGGSEQVKKSKVSGERLAEAININEGLLALKDCISALHAGNSYVPYMNNRLTELLRSALGGNSKTTLVVTASLEPGNASETLHALRFGERCSAVQNDGTHFFANITSCFFGSESLVLVLTICTAL
eukprot:SAG31_NODE_4944_length_2844_cov_1.437887_2_plen_601_part_00